MFLQETYRITTCTFWYTPSSHLYSDVIWRWQRLLLNQNTCSLVILKIFSVETKVAIFALLGNWHVVKDTGRKICKVNFPTISGCAGNFHWYITTTVIYSKSWTNQITALRATCARINWNYFVGTIFHPQDMHKMAASTTWSFGWYSSEKRQNWSWE